MPAVLRGIRFVGRDIFVSKDNNQSNRYLNLQKILSLLSLLLLGRNKLITHATNASPREDFQAQNGSVGKDFFTAQKDGTEPSRRSPSTSLQSSQTFDATSVQWMWMVIGKK